ncbi:hypothetical protein ACFVFQ_36165 [Streptomyces sp. NPDC057743]|uniref:DUF7848 domain-containing protein n=1 Tax=Streptomyces sp. NPDC057743 TaxID=3346236 RepID=UPI003686C398
MAIAETWHVADWGLDIDASGSGSIYRQQCMTCGDKSGAAATAEGPDVWCLRHAERTGHTDFRCAVTTFFRASLVEGAQ